MNSISGLNNYVTLLFGFLSIMGVASTIYFGLRSRKYEHRLRSLTWKEIQIGVLDLLKKVRKEFDPEIILTMSGPGAIVANMAVVGARRFMPVYQAILEDFSGHGFAFKPNDYEVISTEKWNIYLPRNLFAETKRKILLLDDCSVTGHLQRTVRSCLCEKGFAAANVKVAVLVSTKVLAEDKSKDSPDFVWHSTSHSDFFFPWGRWY